MTENLDQFVDAYTPSFRYAHDNEMLLGAYADCIETTLRSIPREHVLSLGIGHRIVSSRLMSLQAEGRFGSYTIIEGSGKLIAELKKALGGVPRGVELIETAFETFAPSRLFEAIEMGFVLEHVDDPLAILSHYKKLLAPGGIIFIAVPNARSLHRLIGNAAGMLPDLFALSEWDRQLGHQRYFDHDSLRQTVARAGLTPRNERGLVLKPLATSQLNQLQLPDEVWRAFTSVGFGLPEVCNGLYLEATH